MLYGPFLLSDFLHIHLCFAGVTASLMIKKILLPVMIALWVGFMCCCDRPHPDIAQRVHRLLPDSIPLNAVVYTVQPLTSKVAWMARKVTGLHYGTLRIKGGEIYVLDYVFVGGHVEVDMQKLVVLDLTDPDENQRLSDHLRSGDFFAVNEHPVAGFRFRYLEKFPATDEEGNNFKIVGDLSIKNITHTIAFNAFIDHDQETISVVADFDLDRTLWDIRYRSGRFFDQLGDNMIDDLFNVKLEIIARKQLFDPGNKNGHSTSNNSWP